MHAQEPRGAKWLADAAYFYSRLVVNAYKKLFPKVDPEILEANRLRRVADRIKIYQPSVAKELYIAADRHELLAKNK